MAKRTRSRTTQLPKRPRVLPTNAIPRMRSLPRLVAPLSTYEDRRTYHPISRAFRPAFSIPRASRIIKAVEPKAVRRFSAQTKATLAFADPRRVLVCLRRRARKEVLLALGKGGGGSKRKPRRNHLSEITC